MPRGPAFVMMRLLPAASLLCALLIFLSAARAEIHTSLSATPIEGPAPLVVDFVAAATSEPALLHEIAWSFTNPDVFDVFGTVAGATVVLSTTRTYGVPGIYTAAFHAWNIADATSRALQSIVVWTPTPTPSPTPTHTPTITPTRTPTHTFPPTPTNAPPVAVIHCTPIAGPAPLAVHLVAGATDPEGALLEYGWGFSTPGGVEQYGSASGPSLEVETDHVYSRAGMHTASFIAWDVRGASGFAEQEIVVHAAGATDTPTPTPTGTQPPTPTPTVDTNQPPVASLSLSETEGASPLLVDLVGSATDPEGRLAEFGWQFAAPGVIEEYSEISGGTVETTTKHPFGIPGVYSVGFHAWDAGGKVGSATGIVRVWTNTPAPAPPDPDFNHDGKVDGADLLLLLEEFPLLFSQYDLDRDGRHDYQDVLRFAAWWGALIAPTPTPGL